MNYLQSLLSLDAAAIASFDDEIELADPIPEALQVSSRLLDAVWREMESVATMAAVSASIVNALSTPEGSRTVSAQALQTYAPPDMPVFASAFAHMIDSGRFSHLAETLQVFETRVSLARRMGLAYAREQRARSSDQTADRTVDLETLQDAWAHACEAALNVISDVSRVRHTQISGPFKLERPGPEQRLSNLLIAAANGLHPCVGSDGYVTIPGWAERRHHKRQLVDFAIEVHNAGRMFSARVFDVSAGGLGMVWLSGPQRPELNSGDFIAIKVPGGRSLKGRIAWLSGCKAGVTLAEPLAAGDALFSQQP